MEGMWHITHFGTCVLKVLSPSINRLFNMSSILRESHPCQSLIGPLLMVVPFVAEVKRVLDKPGDTQTSKHGTYESLTSKEEVQMGKQAVV